MDKNDLNPHQIEQEKILHNRLFKIFISHGITAVLDDHYLAGVLLNVRYRRCQEGRPCGIIDMLHVIPLLLYN